MGKKIPGTGPGKNIFHGFGFYLKLIMFLLIAVAKI